jgi:hypothetical protein
MKTAFFRTKSEMFFFHFSSTIWEAFVNLELISGLLGGNSQKRVVQKWWSKM